MALPIINFTIFAIIGVQWLVRGKMTRIEFGLIWITILVNLLFKIFNP